MEDQSNKAHRPSKEKKKHSGGQSLVLFVHLHSLTSHQTATRKPLASQILDDWQNLLHDRMM
jgi:hypothetical protein